MKLLVRIRSCLLTGLLVLSPVGALASNDMLSTSHPLYSEVVGLIKDNFYNKERANKVLSTTPAPSENAGPAVINSVIDNILDQLDASHTGRFQPDQLEYYELIDIYAQGLTELDEQFFPDGDVRYVGVGLRTKEIDGKTFAAMVYHGGPAHRSGLLTGDEIISVDNAPYHPIHSFREKNNIPVTFEVRRNPHGPVTALEITPETIRPVEAFVSASLDSMKIIEHEGHNIGYVRVWYGGKPVQDAVLRALRLKELKDSDGLVLDLRGGWGGAGLDWIVPFLEGMPKMEALLPDGRLHPSTLNWRKPMTVLIDNGTRSGKEVISFAFKQNGYPLVGERTAGAVLEGMAYALSDKSLLILPVIEVQLDGVRLEGVGVAPTITSGFELPYAAGADPQLERALESVSRSINAAKN